MGGAPFTTIPESFLAKFLLPISVTLGSISVRRFSSQRKKVSTGAAVQVLLNWQMHLPPCPWGFSCQWIRKHHCKDYCPEGAGEWCWSPRAATKRWGQGWRCLQFRWPPGEPPCTLMFYDKSQWAAGQLSSDRIGQTLQERSFGSPHQAKN